jgi:hypothetical protein
VPIVNAVIPAPEFGHGEIEVSPNPAANVMSTKVVPKATTAPAKTAAQLTAGCGDSLLAVNDGMPLRGADVLMLVPDQRQQDYDWDGDAQEPKQNSAAHIDSSSAFGQQNGLR